MAAAALNRCLALALILVVSNTVLTVHSAMHADDGKVHCQLCLLQPHQPQGPTPDAVVPSAPRASFVTQQTPQRRAPVSEVVRAYHQRAPPATALTIS